MGDLVDRSKYVNFNTAKRLRQDFLEPIANKNIEMHIILGNHDVYHKNTNDINAIEELVDKKYNNCKIYYTPSEINVYDTKFLMLPWICDDNRELTMRMIRDTKSQLCMGHLELAGFPMYKGSIESHGDDPLSWGKFDMVMSGHYHHRSHGKNIHYLGSHAEFTWSDWDDPKGFHIFDTSNRELAFIKNPYIMFNKMIYDDQNDLCTPITPDLSKTIIKVVVKSKTNPYKFDKYIDTLDSVGPIEYQIIEDLLDINHEQEVIDESESTLDIFKKYIDKSEIKDIDKKDLEKLIIELYDEALSVE